jgi:glycosyltransferase involved in cell wall biosynthesis
VPGVSITVIHNGGGGPETVAPLPRREPGEPLRLVWAGRYVNQKRVEFFAEIAAACRAAGVPIHLTILGDGPGFSKVKRAIESAGVQDCVEQAGVTTDVFGWLAKSDVFVSASYREGFPNALLEACAAGRPFVVSDIEPHRELLGSSTAGVLVPQDAAKWAEVLGELARDRARLERMAAESLAIGRAFSIEAACEKTVALYRRLMGPA